MPKRNAPSSPPLTARPSKQSRATPSTKPRGSLGTWESLSPSTCDAVAMVEAFLGQDDRTGALSSSATALPSEEADSACPPTAMPRGKFRPLRGVDYTESFVSQLRSELLKIGEASFRKVPLWATCLEMPTRQRLIFRDEFVSRRNTVQMDFRNHRRAMQIHRVGQAQRVPCDGCQRGFGPFRGCVVDADGDALKGACANCAFREHGHSSPASGSLGVQNELLSIALNPLRASSLSFQRVGMRS
ncbi:hypothetical protein M409DRAFT_60343 [Zasmidium cellare ATCC 36951]|uniref:Uncharacterized protein n=1 Tax=Zasmidium cellare ATCC 36951 TaxID=1080233 RepID=A0A6A6C2H6_ZASCE|nr:uncharacterized protein M409DRAFT_60343 [Zasmidium cellare ATCC 36951]KAF2159929.1 hypothetical protein M409DRAFT_60343 [Zasmidium cellare ATCC 36951]